MSEPAETPKTPQLYYLQCRSKGYVGDSPLFWAEYGGYTIRHAEFKKFTEDECRNVILGSVGSHTWNAWPVETVDEIAYKTVCSQELSQFASRPIS